MLRFWDWITNTLLPWVLAILHFVVAAIAGLGCSMMVERLNMFSATILFMFAVVCSYIGFQMVRTLTDYQLED